MTYLLEILRHSNTTYGRSEFSRMYRVLQLRHIPSSPITEKLPNSFFGFYPLLLY